MNEHNKFPHSTLRFPVIFYGLSSLLLLVFITFSRFLIIDRTKNNESLAQRQHHFPRAGLSRDQFQAVLRNDAGGGMSKQRAECREKRERILE